MTEEATRDQFVIPELFEGSRMALQLGDGTLIEGYWSGGEFHVMPPGPVGTIETGVIKLRKVAPWRIHKRTDGGWARWTICKQHALDECEPWCYFETSTEAFEAFATFEPGVF